MKHPLHCRSLVPPLNRKLIHCRGNPSPPNKKKEVHLLVVGPFHKQKWQISLPCHILQQVKSLPFYTPEAWKRYPFRVEPPHTGHYREYPWAFLLNLDLQIWSSRCWARSIQPKFPKISVQNSMDRFGPTGKVSKKLVHLLRWTIFPGRTGRDFGWMDHAH